MERIGLNDTLLSASNKMCDGNVGALTVIMESIKEGAKIDPDSAMMAMGWGILLSLDTHGIYGPRIWMLYKDVCGHSIRKTIAMLRAVQLGLLSESALNSAIDGSRKGCALNVDDVVAKVEEQLPNFQRATA